MRLSAAERVQPGRVGLARGLIEKSAQAADPDTARLWTRVATDWRTATTDSTDLASSRLRGGPSTPLPAHIVAAQFRGYQRVNADLTALSRHYQQVITDLTAQAHAAAGQTRARLLLAYGAALGLVAMLLIRGLRLARRWAARDRRQAAQVQRTDVEARLQRAYEMTDSEER